MGYPYNGLVPPAILFLNPGITRERFVELLDETHTSDWQIKPHQPWDHQSKSQDSRFHEGLNGLARILRLDTTQKFLDFQEPEIDEHGLLVRPPQLLPASPENQEKGYKWELNVHEKNIVELHKRRKRDSWDEVSVGDIWTCLQGAEDGLVTKIYDQRIVHPEEEDYTGDGHHPIWVCDMEISEFYPKMDVKLYKTDAALWKDWPQFSPDFSFDWGKDRGILRVETSRESDDFRWKRIGDKYYLDEETFDLIPEGIMTGGRWGYSDFVLTVEALKRNAWKLISYRGLDHLEQFFRDFPETREAYKRAIWDSHTSLFAKSKGMTNSELIRMRLFPQGYEG